MSSLPWDADQIVTRGYLDTRLAELQTTLTTRFMTMLLAGNATLVGLVFVAVKLG